MKELSTEDYLQHLDSIKKKLTFFIDTFSEQKIYLVEEMASKLRILYMRKSGTLPLFKVIQERLNIEINVWVRETREEELKRKGLENLINEISFGYFNEIGSWLDGGMYQVGLLEAFNRPNAVILGEYKYSAKEIIEIVADKLGGAHIDPKLDERSLFPQTRSIMIGELNLSEHFIIQTTKQTIKIIEMVFNYVSTNTDSEFVKRKKDDINS